MGLDEDVNDGEIKTMLNNQFRQELQQATDRLVADFLAQKSVLEEEHRQRRENDAALLRQRYEADLTTYQAEILKLQRIASNAEAEKVASANELANLKSEISQEEKDKKARFAEYEAELDRQAKREQDLLDRLSLMERQLQTVTAEKEELERTGTKTRADLDLETEKRREAEAALGRDQDRIDHLETSLQASWAQLQDARATLQRRDGELEGLYASWWKVGDHLRVALADKEALEEEGKTTKARLMAELAAKDDQIKSLHAQVMQTRSRPAAAEDPVNQMPTVDDKPGPRTSSLIEPSLPRRSMPSTLGSIQTDTAERPRDDTSPAGQGRIYNVS